MFLIYVSILACKDSLPRHILFCNPNTHKLISKIHTRLHQVISLLHSPPVLNIINPPTQLHFQTIKTLTNDDTTHKETEHRPSGNNIINKADQGDTLAATGSVFPGIIGTDGPLVNRGGMRKQPSLGHEQIVEPEGLKPKPPATGLGKDDPPPPPMF